MTNIPGKSKRGPVEGTAPSRDSGTDEDDRQTPSPPGRAPTPAGHTDLRYTHVGLCEGTDLAFKEDSAVDTFKQF